MSMLKAALAATAMIAFAAPAFAAGRDAPREVSTSRLEVGNVDFRNGDQVRAFHTRLQQTALFVCGVDLAATGDRRAADRQCAEKAVEQAVNQLNRPLLTATYQQSGAPMVARGY